MSPPLRGVRTRLLLDRGRRARARARRRDDRLQRPARHAASRDANTLLRARASSELALLRIVDGTRSRSPRPRDDPLGDSRVWIFRGTHADRGAACQGSDDCWLRVRSRAGRHAFTNVPDDSDERLYAVPIVHDGQRVGTLVTGISLAPYEHTQRDRADRIADAVRRPALDHRRRGLVAAALGSSSGRADDRAGGSVERGGHRPPLRARRAARRADAPGARRSTDCSTGWPQAFGTSAGSRPRCRTSCARRSRS